MRNVSAVGGVVSHAIPPSPRIPMQEGLRELNDRYRRLTNRLATHRGELLGISTSQGGETGEPPSNTDDLIFALYDPLTEMEKIMDHLEERHIGGTKPPAPMIAAPKFEKGRR